MPERKHKEVATFNWGKGVVQIAAPSREYVLREIHHKVNGSIAPNGQDAPSFCFVAYWNGDKVHIQASLQTLLDSFSELEYTFHKKVDKIPSLAEAIGNVCAVWDDKCAVEVLAQALIELKQDPSITIEQAIGRGAAEWEK